MFYFIKLLGEMLKTMFECECNSKSGISAHLPILQVVVVAYVEHGAYLIDKILFIYKLTLSCYLQVTIL